MPSIIVNAIRRIKSEGIIPPTRFAIYRLNNAYLLRRFKIRPAWVETRQVIFKEALGLDDPDSQHHAPTPLQQFGAFRTLMRRYVRPTRDDVLLDFGSGLGAAMLMAATFPLRKIIGVEFSADLNARAADVIERHKHQLATKDFQFVTADARVYEVPAEVTIVYTYNPFVLNTLRKVLSNVEKSLKQHPRWLRFVCCNPGLVADIAHEFPWLRKCAEIRYPQCYAGVSSFDAYDTLSVRSV